VDEIFPEWNFNELKKILLDNKVITQITTQEAAFIRKEMPKKIDEFVKDHHDVNAKWKQYRNQLDLSNSLNKFWNPMEKWVDTAYKFPGAKIKLF